MKKLCIYEERHWRWIGRISNLNMAFLSKTIYRFNVMPIDLHLIFHKSRKNYPKIYLDPQIPPNIQSIPNKKNNVIEIIIPYLKILQSHINKNNVVLTQKQIWRPIEQNQRPKTGTCNFNLLIFDNTKNTLWKRQNL